MINSLHAPMRNGAFRRALFVYMTISMSINRAIIRYQLNVTSHLHIN